MHKNHPRNLLKIQSGSCLQFWTEPAGRDLKSARLLRLPFERWWFPSRPCLTSVRLGSVYLSLMKFKASGSPLIRPLSRFTVFCSGKAGEGSCLWPNLGVRGLFYAGLGQSWGRGCISAASSTSTCAEHHCKWPLWAWKHRSMFDPKEKIWTRGWTVTWRLPWPRFMAILSLPPTKTMGVRREAGQGLMFLLEELRQQGTLKARKIRAGVLQRVPYSSQWLEQERREEDTDVALY